ncbi:hypothetical protein Tsubulata_019311 [Turnera subulata]|uniref:Uncharacterized protein n=1 Tax=Turnera subulata TaxID=218843 RepID=A0A9Q0GKN9_9ROSI|nr:hypothetical protein Tsubulata_019311 [Turnera subulata]
MVGSQRCENAELKKGPWTPEEDQKLLAYIEEHGHGSWRALPGKAGLQRCGKSCRLRWTNYLRPDIKRGKFSLQEEQTIIQLHALLGNRWSAIARHLPKRTDNEIKNYWNTHLKKRLDKMGIDPVTHKPKSNVFGLSSGQEKDVATLSHVAQWESARLEAEARLVRKASPLLLSNPPPQSQPCSSINHIPNKAAVSRPQCLDVLKAWQGVVLGMFTLATGGSSLESPTSTLSFTENIPLPVPKDSGIFLGNSKSGITELAPNIHGSCKLGGMTKEPDASTSQWECIDEELNNQMPVQSVVTMEKLDNDSMEMQGMASSRELNEDAAIGNVMEGVLADISVPNFESQLNTFIDGSFGDNVEDNRNYWNSLLNFTDGSPSPSRIFSTYANLAL